MQLSEGIESQLCVPRVVEAHKATDRSCRSFVSASRGYDDNNRLLQHELASFSGEKEETRKRKRRVEVEHDGLMLSILDALVKTNYRQV